MALPRIPPGAHGRPGPHRVCGAGVAGQHVPARPSFQFLLKRPGTPGAAPPERGRIDVPTAGRSFLCTSRPSPRVSVAGTSAPRETRRTSAAWGRPPRRGQAAGQLAAVTGAPGPAAPWGRAGWEPGRRSGPLWVAWRRPQPTAPERRQHAALTSPRAPSLSPPPRPSPAPSPSSGLSRTGTHTLWVHGCWVLGMALGVPQARAGCPRRPPAAPSTPAPGGLGGPSTAFSPTAPSLQPPRP